MKTKQWVLLASLLCIGVPLAAETIWSGPDFTSVHAANSTTQDDLTENVSLTRGTLAGIYNITQESFYDVGSPFDTRWAFQGLNGNPGSGVTAANFASLIFTDWATSLGGQFNLQGNILNRPGVIHLLSDDIYLDVTFTSWSGANSGGGFSYTRTSPVPLPAAGWFLLSGFGSLLLHRRRA